MLRYANWVPRKMIAKIDSRTGKSSVSLLDAPPMLSKKNDAVSLDSIGARNNPALVDDV